jgi:hypothetical protein
VAGESGETHFMQPPNPSNPATVCNRGEGRLGAAREDHRALLPGDLAGRHEGLPRLLLMVAAERQEAFTAAATTPGSSTVAMARSR